MCTYLWCTWIDGNITFSVLAQTGVFLLCHFRLTFSAIFKQYWVFCKSSFLSGQLSHTHFLKTWKCVRNQTYFGIVTWKYVSIFALFITYLLFLHFPYTDLWGGGSWFRTLSLFPYNGWIIFKKINIIFLFSANPF